MILISGISNTTKPLLVRAGLEGARNICATCNRKTVKYSNGLKEKYLLIANLVLCIAAAATAGGTKVRQVR